MHLDPSAPNFTRSSYIKLAVRFCVARGEGSIEHVVSRQHSASKCAGRGLRVWVQHHYGGRPAARLFCLRDAGRSRSSRSTCSVGYERSRYGATLRLVRLGRVASNKSLASYINIRTTTLVKPTFPTRER